MQQANFTVVTKKVRYSADNLTITWKTLYEEGEAKGSISVLNFVCSGEMVSVPADEVEAVEFHKSGSGHCNRCDGSVWSMVGAGVHANPGPAV